MKGRIIQISVMAFFLFSCSKSTEEKLHSAILTAEKESFSNSGEKVEEIKIDSLNYELMNNASRLSIIRSSEEIRKIGITNSWLDLQDYYLQLGAESYLPAHASYQKSLDSAYSRIKEIDSLIKTVDTTLKIYGVEYVLNAKTNKGTYSHSKMKFISFEDFQEVPKSKGANGNEY